MNADEHRQTERIIKAQILVVSPVFCASMTRTPSLSESVFICVHLRLHPNPSG